MNKVVNEYNGRFYVTDNDYYLVSVLADLAKNNTAFPDITDTYEYMKEVKEIKKDKDGKKIKTKVMKKTLRVYFADSTWTDVTKSDSDEDDNVTALTYAITKRLFGTLTEGGYVLGDGFMNKLKKIADNTRSDVKDAEAKKARIKAKEEEDKKLHEQAEARKNNNPSLGIRLHNLEEKFDKFLDIFSSKTDNKKNK